MTIFYVYFSGNVLWGGEGGVKLPVPWREEFPHSGGFAEVKGEGDKFRNLKGFQFHRELLLSMRGSALLL